jgi:hypothetical protein
MELTPAQRKLAFAVIVLALAGLGAFLLWPGAAAAPGRAAASTRPAPRASSAAPSPAGATTPPLGPVPSASPVNIYAWLPFSQPDLATAAMVVQRFCADYATYSYTESAASYVGRMQGLVSPALAAALARGYATPGVAQPRAQQKQTASGSGVITALRAFGPSDLIFLVTVTQTTSSTAKTGKTTAGVSRTGYAVTVARSGSGWQVNDIQLASAGNS